LCSAGTTAISFQQHTAPPAKSNRPREITVPFKASTRKQSAISQRSQGTAQAKGAWAPGYNDPDSSNENQQGHQAITDDESSITTIRSLFADLEQEQREKFDQAIATIKEAQERQIKLLFEQMREEQKKALQQQKHEQKIARDLELREIVTQVQRALHKNNQATQELLGAAYQTPPKSPARVRKQQKSDASTTHISESPLSTENMDTSPDQSSQDHVSTDNVNPITSEQHPDTNSSPAADSGGNQ